MKRVMWQYFFFILVSILLLTGCGAAASKEAANPSDMGKVSQTTLNKDLGEVYASGEGGYSFQLIPDYEVEDNPGSIYLYPADADPNTGPMLLLIGGLNNVEKTAEDLLEDFKAGMESDLEITKQEPIQMKGKEGLRIEYKGSNNGEKVSGEATFIAVNPRQVFSLIGIYPSGKYNKSEKLRYAALRETIQFQDVSQTVAASTPGQPGEGGVFRQWAAYSKSSSNFSNSEYASRQATGQPDTFSCKDAATAWKPANPLTVEWLEVFFPAPARPTQIDIYETFHSSQISKVEVIDDTATSHVIYTGQPEESTCPSILSIKIAGANYNAIGVRITVDQSQLNLPWAMIDAVEMVGLVEGTAEQVVSAPTSPVTEAPTGQSASETGPLQTTGGDVPTQASGTWTFYTTADGLAENLTRSAAVTTDGTAWIGTGNKGAASFKDRKFTPYSQTDGLGSLLVTSMAIAPDGSVWAGTGWGLAHFEGGSWKNYTTDQGLLSNNVETVAIAPDGVVWAGTSLGLSRFDGQSWQNYKTPDSFPKKQLTDIAFGLDGTLWFANPEGLASFKDGNWKLYTQADGLSYKFVTSVAVAPDGALWAATAGQGANRFDGSTWQVFRKDEGLSYNTQDIAVAADGSLWFSTTGYGVFRYNGETFESWTSGDGLPSDWVDYVVAAPDGSIWAGFRDAGIGRFGN